MRFLNKFQIISIQTNLIKNFITGKKDHVIVFTVIRVVLILDLIFILISQLIESTYYLFVTQRTPKLIVRPELFH